jgi:hypothetical protein
MDETTFVSREDTEKMLKDMQESDVPEPQLEEEQEDEEPLGAELLGLLYVGKLTKTFNFKGHDITIKTLKIGEELEAALLTREFEGTEEYLRAVATSLVSASIESVDGKPLVDSLGPSQDDLIQRKFDYVRSKWYWPTIRAVYDQYVELLQEQKEVLDEFEKK